LGIAGRGLWGNKKGHLAGGLRDLVWQGIIL